MMSKNLRILIIEDNLAHAELIQCVLEDVGFTLDVQRVDTKDSFLAYLSPDFDVVLSDYHLPTFNGIEALQLLREQNLDIPFILVSSIIREEQAIEAIRIGAADYLLKDRLTRLPAAIERAMEQKQLRRQQQKAQEELRLSQHLLVSTLNALSSHIAVIDAQGTIIAVNTAWNSFATDNGTTPEKVGEGINYLRICDCAAQQGDGTAAAVAKGIRAVMAQEQQTFSLEYPCHSPTEERWFDVRMSRFQGEEPTRVVIVHENITVRKKAEDALNRDHAFLDAIVENMPLSLFVKEAKDLRFVRVNKSGEHILGIPREAFLGTTDYDHFPKKEADFFVGKDRDVLEDGMLLDIPEEIIHTPHLGERILHTRKIPILDEHGHPQYLLGISEDITERRQAEEQLHLLSSALEAAANGIVITERDGTISWVNEAFSHLTGYTRDEAIGQNPKILKSGKHEDAYYKNLWDTIQAGQIWQGEIVNQRKDGSTYDERMTITPVRGEGNDITHFIAIKENITERKRAERVHQEGEERLKLALNAAHAGTFYYHFPTDYNRWDENSCGIYGIAPEAFENNLEGWVKRLHPDDMEDAVYHFDAALDSESTYDLSYRIIRPSGEIRHLRAHGFIVRNEEGTPLYTSGLHFDVTERENAQEELERYASDLEEAKTILEDQANELASTIHELERANAETRAAAQQLKENQAQLVQSEKMASLGQLAAGVAHEINNPIGFVTSNISTLSEYVDTFTQLLDLYQQLALQLHHPINTNHHNTNHHNYNNTNTHQDLIDQITEISDTEDLDYIRDDVGALLAESLNGLHRVTEIVQGLKSFARLDEADMQIADINDGIEATLKVVWNEIKYKAEVKTLLGTLPQVRCYPGQLNQVFMNMLVNAAHAIEDRGVITIKTEATDTEVLVHITDTGSGIAEADIVKLFNPFFTTKPVGKGTGLGLSISYGIIEKHRGRIEVESELGRGTTFTIALPMTEDKHD